jgi:hypothetical protein
VVTILQTEGETLFRWVSYFRPVSWPRWGYFKGDYMVILKGIFSGIITAILLQFLPYQIGSWQWWALALLFNTIIICLLSLIKA